MVELIDFQILVSEGFHHPDTQQAVLHLRVDFAHLMPGILKRHAHFPAEVARADQHEGQQKENHQGEPHVGAAQDDKGGCNLHPGDQEFFRTMVGKLRHVKQVAGDAGHDLTHLGFVVIGKGQLLQMVEQIAAHVRFQLGPRHVAPVLHEVVGGGVDDPQQQIHPAQRQHPGGGDPGVVLHRLVGDHLHDLGEDDFAPRGHERAEQVQRDFFFVLAIVGQKTF